MRLLALALVAVAVVPAARAGSGGAYLTLNQLSNHADAAALHTKTGVLIAYAVESTGSVNVTDGTTTHTVVAGWPAVSDPRSNATGKSGYLYEILDDSGAAAGSP